MNCVQNKAQSARRLHLLVPKSCSIKRMKDIRPQVEPITPMEVLLVSLTHPATTSSEFHMRVLTEGLADEVVPNGFYSLIVT